MRKVLPIAIIGALLVAGVLMSPPLLTARTGTQSAEDHPPPGKESEQSDDKQAEAAGETEPYHRDAPPAASERKTDRHRLVNRYLARATLGSRAIEDEQVLEAMRTVPRHVFVPKDLRQSAYRDTPLPIGYGQTISQPYIVAMMTELLELDEDDKVLEIGTGSGYQSAVLAHLTPHVYTIEIIKPLHERAKEVYEAQGYDEIECRRADGYWGWEEHAPFDAIIVTCAAGHLPPPLWEQLKPGGRIVIPIGGAYEIQRLIVASKLEDGSRRTRTVTQVRFVPLTRERGSKSDREGKGDS